MSVVTVDPVVCGCCGDTAVVVGDDPEPWPCPHCTAMAGWCVVCGQDPAEVRR